MVNLMQENHKFYVDFELRPQEDRAASQEAGHPVFKDVEFAVITLSGGNTVIDKIIDDTLLNEWKHGTKVKPPAKFAFAAYEAWKEGLDAPVNGTDLKNWPGITPAQVKQCMAANIRTVEDLAECNAEGQKRLGMGAVALMKKAKAYLESAQDNKSAERISDLEMKLESALAKIEELTKENKNLGDRLDDDKPKRTRRKRNPETGELE